MLNKIVKMKIKLTIKIEKKISVIPSWIVNLFH